MNTSNDTSPPLPHPQRPATRRVTHWFIRWGIRVPLFCVICLVTLLALFYAVENWRGRRAWENFKQRAEAAGDSFAAPATLTNVVAEAENFALIPLLKPLLDYDVNKRGTNRWRDPVAFYWLTGMGIHSPGLPPQSENNWKIGLRVDLREWQQHFRRFLATSDSALPEEVLREQNVNLETVATNMRDSKLVYPTKPEPQSPAEDVLLALTKFESELTALTEGASRPQAQFPVHYEEGFTALMPHLGVLRKFARILQLRAVANLAEVKVDQAFSDQMLCFRLAESLRKEPFLISQLVRLAILEDSLQALWEGLESRQWPATSLESFQLRLEKLDLKTDYIATVRAERFFFNAAMDRWTLQPARLEEDLRMFDDLQAPGWNETIGRMIRWGPSGWIRQNQVVLNQFYSTNLLMLDRFTPPPSDETLGLAVPRSSHNILLSLMLPTLNRIRPWYMAAYLEMAETVCALERYRLVEGRYPPSLQALIPQYKTNLPIDPFTTQPLVYRPEEPGSFVLYSPGPDQKDNNGNPSQDKRKLPSPSDPFDLVWSHTKK